MKGGAAPLNQNQMAGDMILNLFEQEKKYVIGIFISHNLIDHG